MKKQKLEQAAKTTKPVEDSDSEDPIIEEKVANEQGEMIRRVNMPKKNKHRMRAHINPMNELSIAFPKNPNYAQWHLHYPSFFSLKNNNDDQIVVNTGKFQIDYNSKFSNPKGLCPTILDIGCGYGGLMFALTKHFPENLILG